MAGANSSIQITNLDFDGIKNNFLTYLQSQETFQDYNFEGSALNTLVDVLAYNTQYNAYYLNMVANEMFLDSAVQRSSVVSHAKLLNYTPKSAIAPTATVNIVFNNVSDSSLTLPAYLNFSSSALNGVNYNFLNPDSYTVNTVANTATFTDVSIKQGVTATYSFTVNSTSNPNFIFEIPDASIDTSTLKVIVQQSSSNASYSIYNSAKNYLTLDGSSEVYFLQEALNGNYEIYFGDGILGKKLTDGNIVIVNYISTEGTGAAGANSFVLMDTVSGYGASSVVSVTPATTGGDKESIDSIKYQAPKAYAAQSRAVTKEDYITAIQQNQLGFSFDAVNVWGGEENNPPVYGQIFVCLKPTGGYSITDIQKQKIVQNVIKPISVMTVTPTIVDPDYTYIKLNVNVVYDPKKTTSTANQISQSVTTAINNFTNTTLNTFNSTFAAPELTNAIQNADQSIITNEVTVQLQKKFYPNLTTPETYNFYYGTELKKGMFLSGINSSPAVQFQNPLNKADIIDGIYIEEVPSSTGGVESISVMNPGFGYQLTPTVTIQGDGTGATAEAVINTNGTIRQINVLTSGNNYTSAIATITPASNDTTGQLGSVVVNLQGRYGTLRTYYNNTNNVKTIFNQNIGTIDYVSGIVTLNSFGPIQVDDPLGQLTITANPTTTIISSSYNRVITIDPFDSNAITVNVTAKS
jgi:hypothetical protein